MLRVHAYDFFLHTFLYVLQTAGKKKAKINGAYNPLEMLE